jgi:hypothetical protein
VRRAARRCAGAGLVVLVAVATALPSSAAAGFGFKGQVLRQPNSKVSFHIRRDTGKGEPDWAMFSYSHVRIFYADGTTGSDSAPSSGAKFRDEDSFHDRYFVDTASGAFYYDVRGHLLPHGRAQGHLEVKTKIFAEDHPEVWTWTTGLVRWKAERVKP